MASVALLFALLGGCTSGATPDCDGGVCGYAVPETGSQADDASGDGSSESATPDGSSMDSAGDGGSADVTGAE
jgi:hypothetical protein